MHAVTPSELNRYAFKNRENEFFHATPDSEYAAHYYMVDGRKEEMLEAMKDWGGKGAGTVSIDPLRNAKYLFVATITIACRYCIAAGLDTTTAYNASDIYIQKMDRLESVEEVHALVEDMMLFYCDQMHQLKHQNIYAKPVVEAMEYIEAHLHGKIRLLDIAEHAGVSEPYLSQLFQQETGKTFTMYLAERKAEAGKNMLAFSEMSISDIAEYLGFSSPSHFTRVFKKVTDMGPREYRRMKVRERGRGGLSGNATHAEP